MLKNELTKRILAGDYESPDKYRAFRNAVADVLEEQILKDCTPAISSPRMIALCVMETVAYLDKVPRQEQQAFLCRCFAIWKNREKCIPHLMPFLDPKE